MNNLNQVLVEGNLTQDPVLKAIGEGGKQVCTFSIGVDRTYRNAKRELVDEVTFVDVEAWGNLGANCGKYLTKGRGVRIVGHLKQNVWKDKDQKTRSRLFLAADHVEFLFDGTHRKDGVESVQLPNNEEVQLS